MLKERIVSSIEHLKPTLVPLLNRFIPRAVPLLRKGYLRIRTEAFKTPPYGVQKNRLRGIKTDVSDLSVNFTQPSIKLRQKRRYLMVLVLTDSNKFLEWFDDEATRNWDLWVLDLRKNHNTIVKFDAEINSFEFVTKTLLFSSLKNFISAHDYELVTFFDDDLESTVADINSLFEQGEALDFELFQPSLTLDSSVNHENLRIVLDSPGFRSVPLVEIMCPFLSVDFYLEVADLAVLAPSGWGFDITISHLLLKLKSKNPIVLDSVQIRHARKSDPKSGLFYKYLRENGVSPQDDLLRVNHFVGISSESMLLRNISNINDFKNPSFRQIKTFDWKKIQEKGKEARVAILMTKNESDVLMHWISHHYDYFDLLMIVDDESIDGSSEFLEEISSDFKILVFKRADQHGYIQREIITWLSRFVAKNAPQSVIFPLDTDEFLSEDLISNHVTLDPAVEHWKYKWSTGIPLLLEEHVLTNRDYVLIEIRDRAMEKVVYRARAILNGFEVCQGNHGLDIPGSKSNKVQIEYTSLPDLIHIPVRSEGQLRFKKIQAERALIETKSLTRIEGFHWRRLKPSKTDAEILQISADYLKLSQSRVQHRKIVRISGEVIFPSILNRNSFKHCINSLGKKVK